ncbi:DNA polymerase III subunit delta' [Desulfovulcanus sp.]
MSAFTIPESQQRILHFFHKLKKNPPQSLVLEGGRQDQRLSLALYWVMALNCAKNIPCLKCTVCIQIKEQVFRDIVFLDAKDSIGVDDIRQIRTTLYHPPHHKNRVVIINEAQNITPESANALLKSMEEPLPDNHFILLVPQRESLLPTLVSRSFVLTLNWEQFSWPENINDKWEPFVNFINTGQGWFHLTARKKFLTKDEAKNLILCAQYELLKSMHGKKDSKLCSLWSILDIQIWRKIHLALNLANQALDAKANPHLVLDWLAVKLWDFCHQS